MWSMSFTRTLQGKLRKPGSMETDCRMHEKHLSMFWGQRYNHRNILLWFPPKWKDIPKVKRNLNAYHRIIFVFFSWKYKKNYIEKKTTTRQETSTRCMCPVLSQRHRYSGILKRIFLKEEDCSTTDLTFYEGLTNILYSPTVKSCFAQC